MTGPAGSWARLAVVSTLALSLAAAPLTPVLAQEAVAPARLTLADALARSAAADPAVPATEARLRAGEAGVRQADVRPNPTLGLMVENLPSFGGGGIADRTEATLTYEQRLERGGDRPARVSLARAEAAVVQAEALVRRLDRLEMVQRAWAEALAAQAEL